MYYPQQINGKMAALTPSFEMTQVGKFNLMQLAPGSSLKQ